MRSGRDKEETKNRPKWVQKAAINRSKKTKQKQKENIQKVTKSKLSKRILENQSFIKTFSKMAGFSEKSLKNLIFGPCFLCFCMVSSGDQKDIKTDQEDSKKIPKWDKKK